jgi:hypothetical protein
MNTSGWGGKRAGAGRKPKARPPADPPTPIEGRDMLQLLQDVAFGRVHATPLQVRAAIAAVQYTHVKKHDGGKKDEAAGKAKEAAKGRFASAAPPRLVHSRTNQHVPFGPAGQPLAQTLSKVHWQELR